MFATDIDMKLLRECDISKVYKIYNMLCYASEKAKVRKRESTIQVLSERLHSMKEEVRVLRKENASLKEAKTDSEKVIELLKQNKALKEEISILKDILNDPEK